MRPLPVGAVLDPEQTEQVRHLRRLALSPAEIARRLHLEAAEVRDVLEADGTLGRRPRYTPTPLEHRPAVAVDLIAPAEAARHLGVTRDTLRHWVDRLALPYRDAAGHITSDAYSTRWCVFSLGELDRWAGTRRITDPQP